MAGHRERADRHGEGDRRALSDAQQHPESSALLTAIPAPTAEHAGERVEDGDRERARHHSLSHRAGSSRPRTGAGSSPPSNLWPRWLTPITTPDIEPIATM